MVVLRKRTAGRWGCVPAWILGVILFLPAGPVSAQKLMDVKNGNSYSLQSLVDSARRHLPVLLQKQAQVAGAQAGITDARHAYLPKLSVAEELSIGSANDLAGSFMPMQGLLHGISGGITDANSYQAQSGNFASVYGEYELVNFGLRGARVNEAIGYAGLQQADLDKEIYLVKWQMGKLYFAILENSYRLAVDEQNIARYQAMYSIASALTGSGINAGVDSSLAKAELSKTRVSYNQRMGQLNRLRQQLVFLSGIPSPDILPDTTGRRWMDGQTGAGFGAEAGAGAGAGAGHPIGEGFLKEGPGLPALSAAMSDTAANPLTDYYARQKDWVRSEEELVRKSYLPKIMLGAGGWARGSSIQYNNNYEGLDKGLGYQRLNYMAGLGITYDLFNGVHKKDKLAVARQASRAADYAMEQQKLSLGSQAVQADESIRIAQLNLSELPMQLQAAADAYNQKLAQYKAGMINLVDLTNASFVLYAAQSGYIEALNDWWQANLEKAATTGNLDLFIQTVK